MSEIIKATETPIFLYMFQFLKFLWFTPMYIHIGNGCLSTSKISAAKLTHRTQLLPEYIYEPVIIPLIHAILNTKKQINHTANSTSSILKSNSLYMMAVPPQLTQPTHNAYLQIQFTVV